ncbi:MAG TPA: hypothetical protein VJL59_08520 [Anaerolineales bacterium]|nr:hypothetical protein [Anaerolineales bacterium]
MGERPGEFWDGVARLNARGEGPVFLFRPAGSRHPQFQLRLPWTLPGARYTLRDETDSRDRGEFGGDELAENGITITLPQPATAKVFVLTLVR